MILIRACLFISLLGAAIMLIRLAAAAELFPGDAADGKALVEELCSRCHGTQTATESPFVSAPLLLDLANRWPLESLSETLAEGITVGHPAMPAFEFTPREIDDILAYLETLQY